MVVQGCGIFSSCTEAWRNGEGCREITKGGKERDVKSCGIVEGCKADRGGL